MTARPVPGRLTKRPQFLAVATGRRFHTERVTVQLRPRGGETPEAVSGLRFGFTVTRKAGHATERNRIRRRLKAAATEACGGDIAKPCDIVVIGRHAAISAPYRLLVEDLARALCDEGSARPGTSSNARGRRRGCSRTA